MVASLCVAAVMSSLPPLQRAGAATGVGLVDRQGDEQPADGQTSDTTDPGRSNEWQPGPSLFLPIVPAVDAEIAAVLERQHTEDAVAEMEAMVALEQRVADDAVELQEERLAVLTTELDAAEKAVARQNEQLQQAEAELIAVTAQQRQAAQTLVQVGVDLYVLSGTQNDPTYWVLEAVVSGADIQDPSTAMVYQNFVIQTAERALEHARLATEASRDARDDTARVLQDLETERDAKSAVVERARVGLDDARRHADDVRSEGRKKVDSRRAAAPVLPVSEMKGGLTIMGEPLVPAAALAEFARRVGQADPRLDLDSLAAMFIAEGRAEGVRSDVAWVQSILETGWFSFRGSMVHTVDNNYAGIGACDSCSRGILFDSPLDGVRSQIQLLKTYATKGLRTEDLANPPPRLVPERSFVRGCCDTWMKLSGVWATGPGYGVRILTLYNQLLTFAASRASR